MSNLRIAATAWSRWLPAALAACVLIGALSGVLSGCTVQPYRPFMTSEQPGSACTSPATADRLRSTPEVPDDKSYTLHFVEFDDQGWPFPDRSTAPSPTWSTSCTVRAPMC